VASAVSPRGRFVIEKTTGDKLLLTDTAANTVSDLFSFGITTLAFLPDGQSFLTADKDRWISVWNAATGRRSQKLIQTDEVVRSIAVAPDGDSFAIGGRGGLVAVYDMATLSPILDLSGQYQDVNCVRFSPNGRRIAVASGSWMTSEGGRVAVWDLDSQTVYSDLDFESVPSAVAFISNNELIVGRFDGQADWINLLTKAVFKTAIAKKEAISAAAFSPNNPSLEDIQNFQPVSDALATQSAGPVPSFDSLNSLSAEGPSEASR